MEAAPTTASPPAPPEVHPTGFGRAAEHLCFIRALNSQLPRAYRIIDDPLARRLLPLRWRLLLTLIRLGGLERYVLQQLDQRWPGSPVYGAIRSRMIDEMLEARLRRRYEQFVILGAGLQTRAYRSGLYPEGTRVFEVDAPDAIEMKQGRAVAAGAVSDRDIQYVGCDMGSGDIIAALERAGYDPKARTIFLWENGSFAFSGDRVEAILRNIHQGTVPGSVLIFDFMDGQVVYDEAPVPGGDAVKAYLTTLGLPPRFGIRPGKEVPYLRRRGYRHRRTFGPGDFTLWLDTHPAYRGLTIPQVWYICECLVE